MKGNGQSAKVTQPSTQLLLANNLQKYYGPRPALRSLSFSLQKGHILGFLGPNGAGKTTAIRILTTILEPDQGYYMVDDISSDYPEQIRRRIGVLPEGLGFPRHITGIEYLTYFGQLYGYSKSDARVNSLRLLEEVGLQQRAKSLIGTFSHGMRQRIGIARALVNNPVVVFLDEPTLGLDPRGQQELLTLIQRITRERNVGVILCSHALSEIEGYCDDVVIMSSGQVVAQGSVADVVGRVQQNTLNQKTFRIRTSPDAVEKALEVLKVTSNVKKVTLVNETDGWLRVELENIPETSLNRKQPLSNQILQALIRAKVPILGFEAVSGRLQDVFLELTEEIIQ